MSKLYIGLGSNLGDRLSHLRTAFAELRRTLGTTARVSPVYETRALLPETAPTSWEHPYLNCVVEVDYTGTPAFLLSVTKEIELILGRTHQERWAPRTIDVDLLHWEGQTITSSNLTLPHPELSKRAFVLDPLKDLAPSLRLPPTPAHTVLELARKHPGHSPLWMVIVNLTPDSFSDGGQWKDLTRLRNFLETSSQAGVPIFDFGAESTRPDAIPLTAAEEWARLEPALHLWETCFASDPLRPWLSIDTRYALTAARALELGADIINDVSGLADPEMLPLLQSSTCDYVLMHSLSVPVRREETVSEQENIVDGLKRWLEEKLDCLSRFRISLDRVVFDPGIGFGKTPTQSMRLMRSLATFQSYGVRVLIGHSRKSWMNPFTSSPVTERDWETVGASLSLTARGVDLLRVHQVDAHLRAFRAWNHVHAET